MERSSVEVVLEGKVEDLTDLGGAGGPGPHLGLEGEVAPAVGDHLVAIHPHQQTPFSNGLIPWKLVQGVPQCALFTVQAD